MCAIYDDVVHCYFVKNANRNIQLNQKSLLW